jgi:hypothetical protein
LVGRNAYPTGHSIASKRIAELVNNFGTDLPSIPHTKGTTDTVSDKIKIAFVSFAAFVRDEIQRKGE